MISGRLFCFLFTFLLITSNSLAAEKWQLGLGYGVEFDKNSDISQLEFFLRQPLKYRGKLGTDWYYGTGIEYGGAAIHDGTANSTETARLSVMPQIYLGTSERFYFLGGIGTGFLLGETDLSEQDLGGAFLLSAKFGFHFQMNSSLGAEYYYYHQSNGGLYDVNSGLNMHTLALTYAF